MPRYSPRQNGKAARLQRSASRLRRLAAAIRPDADAQPEHELRRRLPSGRTVPASETGRTWLDLVAKPAIHNRVSGGSRLDQTHPSRKHDVDQPDREYLVENPPGIPRREKRAHTRAVAKANAHRAKASKPPMRLPIESPAPSRAVRRWSEQATPNELANARRLHDAGLADHLDKAVARQMARQDRARNGQPIILDEAAAFRPQS